MAAAFFCCGLGLVMTRRDRARSANAHEGGIGTFRNSHHCRLDRIRYGIVRHERRWSQRLANLLNIPIAVEAPPPGGRRVGAAIANRWALVAGYCQPCRLPIWF